MKITVIGSGTSLPNRERSSSGYWVETATGTLMLDFSPSAIHRLAQENLDWANLDAIWISHFHLDHFGGLAPFLFGTKNARETQPRKKPMRIFGPTGLRTRLEVFNTGSDFLNQPFPLEIVEVKERERFEILKDLEAVSISTPHTEESRAIKILENDEKSLVYSSDTGFSKELSAFAKNVDLFILECSFIEAKPVEKHLDLLEAVYMARLSGARLTLLTHLYPEWDRFDLEEFLRERAESSKLMLAFDGLKLEI